MTLHRSARAFVALLALTGTAHGAGVVPGLSGGPSHCDGWCLDTAWDWFTLCRFASGMANPMKMQPADAAGNPTDPGGLKWNVPFEAKWTPTIGLNYTNPPNQTDTSSTPAQSKPVASWGASAPPEYAGICTQFGAGFFYLPGTDTCLRFGSNSTYEQNKEPIYDAQLRTAGGLSYESTLLNAPAGSAIGYNASAIEHANICDTYGAGFYYMPGTETCIKLGANLRYDWKVVPNNLRIKTKYDPQKSLSQIGTNTPAPQQPAQQTLQQLGTNAPVIQQQTPQTKTPETPQQQATSADDGQYINIHFKARPWGDQKLAGIAGTMVALDTGNVPDLPGQKPREQASDANYNRDRLQTTIGPNSSGKIQMPYSLRAEYRLQDAKPNSNYVVGLEQPQVYGALVNVTGKSPIEAGYKLAERLDSIKLDKSPFISDAKLGSLFSVIGYDPLVIGVFSYVRVLMHVDPAARERWDELLQVAYAFGLDPTDLAFDECRFKLPALDLDPASSTAAGRQIPSATLKLAAIGGKRNGVR